MGVGKVEEWLPLGCKWSGRISSPSGSTRLGEGLPVIHRGSASTAHWAPGPLRDSADTAGGTTPRTPVASQLGTSLAASLTAAGIVPNSLAPLERDGVPRILRPPSMSSLGSESTTQEVESYVAGSEICRVNVY